MSLPGRASLLPCLVPLSLFRSLTLSGKTSWACHAPAPDGDWFRLECVHVGPRDPIFSSFFLIFTLEWVVGPFWPAKWDFAIPAFGPSGNSLLCHGKHENAMFLLPLALGRAKPRPPCRCQLFDRLCQLFCLDPFPPFPPSPFCVAERRVPVLDPWDALDASLRLLHLSTDGKHSRKLRVRPTCPTTDIIPRALHRRRSPF